MWFADEVVSQSLECIFHIPPSFYTPPCFYALDILFHWDVFYLFFRCIVACLFTKLNIKWILCFIRWLWFILVNCIWLELYSAHWHFLVFYSGTVKAVQQTVRRRRSAPLPACVCNRWKWTMRMREVKVIWLFIFCNTVCRNDRTQRLLIEEAKR